MPYASFHSRMSIHWMRWTCIALNCFAATAFAQDDTGLPNLLFEPVVIEVIEAEADDAVYTVRELTRLPSTGQAVELQSWLAGRESKAVIPPEQLAADIAAYERSILELESRGGAFAARLDEELLALGALLQQSGDYGRAQQVYERALHVNRVNDGLFNMGQVPIIERTIENHLARGDLVAADAQHEYLLYVQRKSHEGRSVDLLPALTRFAEWNLFAFGARLVPSVPPALTDGDKPKQDSGSDTVDFRIGRLMTAHDAYQSLIAIVANNFGASDARLLNFERQLALTNYLYIAAFGLEGSFDAAMMPYGAYSGFAGMEPGRSQLGFRQGRDALQRRVSYLAAQESTSAEQKAQAKLDLADWMLMFSKRMGSLDIYTEAWNDLRAAGTSDAELTALFDPPFPVAIPSYLEHPYSRASLDIPADLALQYKGYVDVEFRLSRFGVPSAAKVLSKTETATPAVESMLLRHLRRTQFRPRLTDGSVRDNETMQVRFYFTY